MLYKNRNFVLMMENNDNQFTKIATDLNLNNVLEQYNIELQNPNIEKINDAIKIMETQNKIKQNTEMQKTIDNLYKFRDNVIIFDEYNKENEILNNFENANRSDINTNPLDNQIKNFNKNNLRKVETNDRSAPITTKTVQEEIKIQEEIKTFDKNNLRKVETNDRSAPILPKPGNVNLESESMIRRAFGIGSQNAGDLKELLNITKQFYTFKKDTLKNFNDILKNNAKNLSSEQLSKAIQELKTAKNDIESKRPDFQNKIQYERETLAIKRLNQMILKMEELRDRPVIKELEVAKSKMNTWNRLFDKKTYNEAKETLNNKENLNKLGEYAEKVSKDPNMSEQVKDKLMNKIGDLVKDMEKNIDSKISKDQKKIDKQEQKAEKYGKEIQKLESKLEARQEKSKSRESDIRQLKSNTSINNPKIIEAINKLSQENLKKLDSSYAKEEKLENKINQNQKERKNSMAEPKKEVLGTKVENRQEMKTAVEGVGKHVEKYKADKAAGANKGRSGSTVI